MNYSREGEDGNNLAYTIYQFAAPKSYNPPENCGDIRGSQHYVDQQKCEYIKKSKIGCDVYFVKPEHSEGIDAYCRINGTLVTFESFGNFMGGDPALQKEAIVSIFDGLKESNVTELDNLKTE